MKNIKPNILFNSKEKYFALKIDEKVFLDSNANIIKIKNKKELNLLLDFINKFENTKELYKSYAFKLLQIKYGISNNIRKVYITEILGFINTDASCYRAEKNSELAQLQNKVYKPLFLYCKKKYNLDFIVSYSVMPFKQSNYNAKIVEKIVKGLDNVSLIAFYHVTSFTNSIIVSLNILDENINQQKAWEIINIENFFNTKKWGNDVENEKKLLLKKKLFIDIINFRKYLKLAGVKK